MRVDGVTIRNRFKCHDYAMAGVVKQFIDATSIRSIDHGQDTFDNRIESIMYTNPGFRTHAPGCHAEVALDLPQERPSGTQPESMCSTAREEWTLDRFLS